MENESRKTGSDLTTSDLAASVQKRPEPAVPDSQFPKTQSADSRSSPYGAATAAAREEAAPLFAPDDAQSLRARWDAIEVGFADEPRRSVEEADHLVAETMKRLA